MLIRANPDDMTQTVKYYIDMLKNIHSIEREDGEPLLIDMDTLCMSHPVFELGSIFNAFVGYSELNHQNMMDFFGYSCMIFVKRHNTVPYTAPDKVSIVFNFLMVFVVLPFMTLVVLLMPIYVSGDEIIYKLVLCVPAITVLSVAASLSLRRKNHSATGFCVQFAGPVLLSILAVLESLLPV